MDPTKRYTAIDLFAGCGGASYGYRRVGFDIKFAYDIHPEAVNTFNLNFGDHTTAKQLDLSQSGVLDVIRNDLKAVLNGEPLDAVFASPPCTDFSLAGLREEGEAAALSIRCADLIIGLNPRFFIVENVPEFLSSGTFPEVRTRLLAKYDIVSVKINAARVRVPQARVRTFVIGIRTDLNTQGRLTLDRMLEAITDGQETGMMSFADAIPSFRSRCYYICPRNQFKRGIFTPNMPCPTLRTNCTNRLNVEKYEKRPSDSGTAAEAVDLSIRQLCLLMTFPTSYRFPDAFCRTTCGRLIGNAVPCNLASYVGRHVIGIVQWLDTCPKRIGVYMAGIASSSAKAQGIQAVSRVRRVIRLTNESDLKGIVEECRVLGAELTRVQGSNRLQYDYEIGTTDSGDDRMATLLSFNLPLGWRVRVKDRTDMGDGGGPPDDIFFYSALQKRCVRSLRAAKKLILEEEKAAHLRLHARQRIAMEPLTGETMDGMD
jgi:DNA (cytosine-5)-methyltransferase 1